MPSRCPSFVPPSRTCPVERQHQVSDRRNASRNIFKDACHCSKAAWSRSCRAMALPDHGYYRRRGFRNYSSWARFRRAIGPGPTQHHGALPGRAHLSSSIVCVWSPVCALQITVFHVFSVQTSQYSPAAPFANASHCSYPWVMPDPALHSRAALPFFTSSGLDLPLQPYPLV